MDILEQIAKRDLRIVGDGDDPPPFDRTEEKRREDEYLALCWRCKSRGVPDKDIPRIASGDLEPTEALEAARQFLADPKLRILVLSGMRGTGKTVAAGWITSQESPDAFCAWKPELPWPEGREPKFLDVSRLARVSRYKADEVSPLEAASILAVDDLGSEFADEKGSFLATLDAIVNARYAAGLRTVVTANLPAQVFRERYRERIADRIREVGRFVELSGASLRGKANP